MQKNERLEPSDVTARLRDLQGWSLDRDIAITRQFVFSGFPDALTFIVRLGFAAEAADHHPDLLVSYKRVTVTSSTHSAGGLTDKDFAGAKEATALAGRLRRLNWRSANRENRIESVRRSRDHVNADELRRHGVRRRRLRPLPPSPTRHRRAPGR